MDKTGAQEAARFALPAGCGGPGGKSVLLEGFRSGEDEPIKEALAELPHLNAFLGAISQITERDKHSLGVVTSYWLGGGLPETEEPVETRLLAKHYAKTISPESAQALLKRLPEKVYLTHLTMVALIASADLGGNARLAGINHCMVSGGRVMEINTEEGTARVERDVLVYKEDGGFDVISKKTVVRIDSDLTPTIEIGNQVAIHQGVVADILTPEDFDRLNYWNKKVAQTLKIS